MPCFRSAPTRGTPAYDAWLPGARRQLDAFTHVVDYYFRKAGISMPEPPESARPAGPPRPRRGPRPEAQSAEHAHVLNNILMHLDCDAVNVFDLNEARNLLYDLDRSPKNRGYLAVLGFCFRELRNGYHDRPTTGKRWSESDRTELMLEHVRERISERKLRLFAVACCRRVPHLLTDKRSSAAVETAERHADGLASTSDLAGAESQALAAWPQEQTDDSPAACAAASSAFGAARDAAWAAFGDRDGMGEEKHQAALLRCIAGNPFQTVTFDPAWLTPTVTNLAARMYEERDFSAMTILADALQDAGCESRDVIEHCRQPGPHARGCWVVDGVLGKQ